MHIDFHRNYTKRWIKLTLSQQQRALAAIELLLKNPQAPQLRLHQLKGEYYPQFSISAGGDLRLHFLKFDPHTIVLMAIGTHAQLYD